MNGSRSRALALKHPAPAVRLLQEEAYLQLLLMASHYADGRTQKNTGDTQGLLVWCYAEHSQIDLELKVCVLIYASNDH